MKIIYDHRIFSTQQYGGISRYFFELIKNIIFLNDKNVEQIFLFQGFYLCNYDLKNLNNKILKYTGFKRPKIKKTTRIFEVINKIFFKYYLFKDKIYLKSNVVYHPTYYGTGNYLKNAKIVYTIHDMIYERFPKLFNNSYKIIINKKISTKQADHIICVSDFTKRDLITIYGTSPTKIDVVYHGTSLDMINTEELINVDKYNPYILYVGDKRGYKNFSLVFECFTNNKLYEDFNLICFGGEGFSNKEIETINKFNINGRIFQINGDDILLASFYRHAFCLIYPSKYEGFGLPVLEAMSLGCPVICSNTSSLPEVGGNAVLYINPDDENELLHSLESLDTDYLMRKNLVEKGFAQAKKFSWKKTAQETINVYKKLLS